MVAAPAAGRLFHHATAVGLADVTPARRARLDAVARCLQDAAWADIVDAGVEDHGVWIVRRTDLRVERAPRFGEALAVATFCSGVGSLWAERRSTVRGADGAHVEAAALWVHLSQDGARPRPLPPSFHSIYAPSAGGRRVKARLHHPAEPPSGAAEHPWRFRAADLDMAAHVNNAVYWAVLEEELAGAELPDGWRAEIEHRAPADAGPATIVADGAMRWIVSDAGDVLATIRVGDA
jgi:acyl-ACP thioesterase